MTWHKKPLSEIFDEFGFNKYYSEEDNEFFTSIGQKNFKDSYNDLGDEIYKKLGLPNKSNVIEHQRKKFGSNKLTELNVNPWYCILFAQLTNFFSILLYVGGILCFIA